MTGTSTKSIDDAAGRAVSKAVNRGLEPRWFAIDEVGGAVVDGRIRRFEVAVRVGIANPVDGPKAR